VRQRKSWISWLLLTWGLAGLAWVSAPFALGQDAEAEGRPVAVFPALIHDFGQVDRGDKLQHTFIVRNEGDAPLEILSAKPT
jgi:hypothetical protein